MGEQQPLWHADVMRTLGLTQTANNPSWPGGCWNRAPNRTCGDILKHLPVPLPASAVTQTEGQSESHLQPCIPRVCSVGNIHVSHSGYKHNTGACWLMQSFYTKELAAIVTDFARIDLQVFGYPPWAGPSRTTPLPLSESCRII